MTPMFYQLETVYVGLVRKVGLFIKYKVDSFHLRRNPLIFYDVLHLCAKLACIIIIGGAVLSP
jgi:hypothetical protein